MFVRPRNSGVPRGSKLLLRIAVVANFPAFSDYLERLSAASRCISVEDRRGQNPKLEVKSDSQENRTKEDLRECPVLATTVVAK